MKTMSWSRYHALTRIRTQLRSRSTKRMRRAAKAAGTLLHLPVAKPGPGCQIECAKGEANGGFLARMSQFFSWIFYPTTAQR